LARIDADATVIGRTSVELDRAHLKLGA